MSRAVYSHKFVKAFPDKIDDDMLYVSVEFGTAAHRCFCGCGSEVYTRFSPRDWSMKFNGETVSISPSIGNWSFACQSHYILDAGRVHWASRWSRERIELGRLLDRERKERHLGKSAAPSHRPVKQDGEGKRQGPVARFLHWLIGR
jgi:hypothetical protein